MTKEKLVVKTCRSVSGYAQLTQKTLQILNKYYDCLQLPLFNDDPLVVNYEKFDKSFQAATELVIASLPGDAYNTILSSLSSRKKCLLLTMWESTRLTGWHVRELEEFKHIFVPSDWNLECFANSGFNNVSKLNLFVDDKVFAPIAPKNKDVFTFITGGANLKSTGNDLRKDLPKIIKCFNTAFPAERDVELKVKLSSDDYRSFGRFLDERIRVVSHIDDEKDYADFLASGDVFVSPSKSEGWGFMQIESLAVGRPIISPIYSGLAEFLNKDNCFATPFFEKLAANNWGRSGGLWAEVPSESIIAQMRNCYHRRKEIRANYKTYSDTVLPKFSTENYEKNLISLVEKYG